MKKNKVVFIAGMHRSGTSLTGQWFHANNVFLGEKLLSGFSDNKYGHFEDMGVLEIMVDQFKMDGLNGNGLILGNKTDFCLNSVAKERIKNWIIRRNLENIVWGWKEPRSTLFLQDFKKSIPELKVVAVYRQPELVIQSLYRRLSKNKWYYTRNPIKKIIWFCEIDLQKYKWERIFENAYIKYNNAILDFKDKYPEDILIINSNNLLDSETKLVGWLNQFVDFDHKVSFSEIFDKEIYSKSKDCIENELKFKNSYLVYNELEKFEF